MFLQVLFICNICDPVNNSFPVAPAGRLPGISARHLLCPSPSEWRSQRVFYSGWIALEAKVDTESRKEDLYPGLGDSDMGIWVESVSAQFSELGGRGVGNGSDPHQLKLSKAARTTAPVVLR